MAAVTFTDLADLTDPQAGEDLAGELDDRYNALKDATNDSVGVLFQVIADTLTSITLNDGRIKNGATITAVAGATYSTVSTPALVLSNTNYVEVDDAGAVAINQSAFTAAKKPICTVVMDGSGITAIADKRAGFDFSSTTIANDSVTFAMLQNSSGASKLVGRGSASGAGDYEEITLGTGLALTGTTLATTGAGTGDMEKSVYDTNDDGLVDVAAGGTGAATAVNARSNLGLIIGTNVQAHDATLTALAGVTTAADKLIYATGSDTFSTTDLTTAGRALLDDASATAQRTTLGLGTAAVVDVPASGDAASDEAVLGDDTRLTDTRIPTDNTVATVKIQDDAVTYAKMQNVSATDKILGRSTAGAGNVEEITCTSFARTILDDTTAAAVRTTIGATSSTPPALVTLTDTANVISFDASTGNNAFEFVMDDNFTLSAAEDGMYHGQVVKFNIAVTGSTRTLTAGTDVTIVPTAFDYALPVGNHYLWLEWDASFSGSTWAIVGLLQVA